MCVCVCVCVCARARARACVRACTHMCILLALLEGEESVLSLPLSSENHDDTGCTRPELFRRACLNVLCVRLLLAQAQRAVGQHTYRSLP